MNARRKLKAAKGQSLQKRRDAKALQNGVQRPRQREKKHHVGTNQQDPSRCRRYRIGKELRAAGRGFC